ncbi:hypothetical protein D3C75_773220 [compost metagenome]
MAADAVIQHEHPHTLGGLAQQQLLQRFAKVVVMDDEELHQHYVAGFFDGGEYCIECCLAIDQQLHLVIGKAGHAPELGHGAQRRIAFRLAGGKGFFYPRPPVEVGHGHMHFLVGLAPGLDVGIERARTEDQVRDQGEVGDEEQRHGPGDCALGSAHGEQCVQCGDDTQQVNQAE